ncbi:MAG: hypothetical protein ABI321_16000 [Polyangia bacterium]
MRRSTVRRLLLLAVPVGIVGAAMYVSDRRARVNATSIATTCYGDLNGTTYPTGVANAPLASNTSIAVKSNGLQLDTNLTPFNAQNITLPFDQQLNVKYVYRNAGASHSFGWFYYDQVAAFVNTDGTLKDADNDGILDWFQTQNAPTRPNMGLWQITGSNTIPDITNSALNYADGGPFPHVPNTLEALTGPGKGSWIFKLCDDDTNYSSYGVGSNPGSYPIYDGSNASDGIPDYDVNGDGTIGNEADRAVNLGVVQGNREIIFFALTYYDSQLPKYGLGIGKTGSGSNGVKVMPFFTKNILNPDRGTLTPGKVIQKIALKCKPAESGDDSGCWNPLGGTNGFLTPEATARLNTPVYNNVNLTGDNTVIKVAVAADGSAPHFVVLPPASNPNLWLIGYEDLPNNVGDNDYNDVVFMVERANGGQVISNVVSDIPPAVQDSTTISTVHVTYAASFPAPGCNGVSAQIKLYYSVDNGVTWNAVPQASLTSGDVTIDVLGAGVTGSQLKWRADFVSPVQACEPVLTSFNIGYNAVSHGVFKFAAPIPLANVAYSGALETPPFPTTEPTATNADYSLRGHFSTNELYAPTTPGSPYTTPPTLWDSGLVSSSVGPDARSIWTSVGGVTTEFKTANSASLYQLVLPTSVRTATNSAKLVYDFNGDNVVNDVDAQFLLQWTRGWEFPSGITFTPAPTAQPQARAWRLGAMHNSSPAVIGPPVRPTWIDGYNAPATLAAKHNAYRLANTGRLTRAIVGSQDGMLHAFDAGQFRPTDDAAASHDTCSASLLRGCFAGTEANAYGTGKEVWAWIPPSQLSQLKNNEPYAKGYLPGSNPLAEVDGSVSVEDIWDPSIPGGGSFRTMAYASLGTSQRYITAVDMSTDLPKSVWATDFTDADFSGSNLSPSIGLMETPVAPGYAHQLVVSSGLNSAVEDEYVYFIDALSGAISKKVQLNVAPNAAQATGIAGYVSLVDADTDGMPDRVYTVDTAGRVFKVDTTTQKACLIASMGETNYSGLAVQLMQGSTLALPKVQIFVGGGSNPDGSGAVASNYHIFSYEDDDPVGTCSQGKGTLVYKYTIADGSKVWAAPTVNDTNVFFATAGAASQSVCATGTGSIITLGTTGTAGVPAQTPTITAIAGAAISSMRVYDGHVLVNTIGGSTTVLGSGTWNNTPTAGNGTSIGSGLIGAMRSLLWQEL